MSISGIPRWVILLLGAGLIAFGFAASQGWIRDPSLAKADYIGTTDISAEEAKLYRAVPFEWRVNNNAGSFKGDDKAFIRIDSSGERTVLCGWVRLDKAGASIRATRSLLETDIIRMEGKQGPGTPPYEVVAGRRKLFKEGKLMEAGAPWTIQAIDANGAAGPRLLEFR